MIQNTAMHHMTTTNTNNDDEDNEAGILVSDTGNTGLMYCMPEGECVIPATYTWDEKHDDDAKKDKSYHGDQLSGG